MKKITTFCIFLLFVQLTSAQLATWARTGGGSGNDEVHSISAHPSGTSFVCGNFYSPCAFDSLQLALPDTANAFIAKISDTGSTLWLKYFPTPGNSYGSVGSVAAAWDGGCFITGIWTDTILLDSTLFVASGAANRFFARLSQNGSVLWAKRAIGVANSLVSAVATNQQGDVYFTGHYSDSISIDTTTITNPFVGGYGGSFIAKFDSTGMLIWLNNLQGSFNLINDIALDPKENVVVIGYFGSLAVFDTVQLTNLGNNQMFIAKYDSAGRFLWVRQDGGVSEVKGAGIAICPNNDIVVTGSYTAPFATFDTITIPYLSGDDFSGFVARYDQDGNIKWVNYQSSIHGDVWNYVVSTGTGNAIYFSGFYYDTLYFSNGGFMETGPASYIASCDVDGNMLWVRKFVGGDFNFDFSIDTSQRIYISGIFRDSIIITPYQFTSQGNSDFFFAQIGASTVSIQENDGGYEMVVSPNPSNGNFILTLADDKFESGVMQIYNELGALIFQRKLNYSEQTRRIEFNLDQGIKSGLYMIVLINKDKRYTKRIVLGR